MPGSRRPKTPKRVESFRHDEAKRPNLPSAEHQSVMSAEDQAPIRRAIKRRNRDLDPQLVWRGKNDDEAFDVQAPPLFIQEKVHPKALIDDLRRVTAESGPAEPQVEMWDDFNGLPSAEARTEFYAHEANWSNRMILGDSLQVMASLADREGLRGKVQSIYIDPPYGIKFNSNFQWSTTSHDVTDGKADHITREPEQVKAFRDTWRDGIHSYLSYLRDRLLIARELLTESGSVFVQIGDENVHRVRAVMDEVFGEENFVGQIAFSKTTGFSGRFLSQVTDTLVWYARRVDYLKYRSLWREKRPGDPGALKYRPLSTFSQASSFDYAPTRLATSADLTSQGASALDESIRLHGHLYPPKSGLHWKTKSEGLRRLAAASRLFREGSSVRYLRFLDDFSIFPISNVWEDIGGVQSRTDPKVYVVQTATEAVKRCLLMTTDPGDLVLDPTCGAGTTAYVAEQWGRRWITIDTSRVALALARARIMGARYPYYLLADSAEGQKKEAEITRTPPKHAATYGRLRQGFVYRRVPHITLKAIANNAEIDVIWEQKQPAVEAALVELNQALQLGAVRGGRDALAAAKAAAGEVGRTNAAGAGVRFVVEAGRARGRRSSSPARRVPWRSLPAKRRQGTACSSGKCRGTTRVRAQTPGHPKRAAPSTHSGMPGSPARGRSTGRSPPRRSSSTSTISPTRTIRRSASRVRSRSSPLRRIAPCSSMRTRIWWIPSARPGSGTAPARTSPE